MYQLEVEIGRQRRRVEKYQPDVNPQRRLEAQSVETIKNRCHHLPCHHYRY